MTNQVWLIGNLVQDVVYKTVRDKGIANFRVAVNDKYNEETLYVNVVAFNKLAELVNKFLSKGDKVSIVGKLQIKQVEDKYYTEIIANDVEFLTPKGKTPQDFM